MPNSADFNHFTNAPTDINISRSAFNMQHTIKLSGNAGDLIPFEVREILPGDTFSVDTTKVIRLQPLVAPIMDECYADFYWFFCPNRLVWNHFVNFMGENTESEWTPTVEYEIPQLKFMSDKGNTIGSIADYMGIPLIAGANSDDDEPISKADDDPVERLSVSALPFRAYALTCDQWFRAQAIQDPVHVFTDDEDRVCDPESDDMVNGIELGGRPFIACKLFDQFTSALPAPQRGAAVTFDLAGMAPVVTNENLHLNNGGVFPAIYRELELVDGEYKFHDSTSESYVKPAAFVTANGSKNIYLENYNDPITSDHTYEQMTPVNLWADMSTVTTFNINDLRTAFAIQRYLERSARSGGRYIEMLSAFFHVDSPDARLQRVEYLGGSRLPININSVTQTSATDSQPSPLGNVAGMSVTGEIHSDFTKSFTEHGILLGLMCLRYRHSYSQGVEPFWKRKTKYDFYNPVFANLGEMPVYNHSIYVSGVPDTDNGVFGYQEAWYDYRYANNRVCSEMRPDTLNSLAFWHLGDNYEETPHLSPDWIVEDKSNLDRCLAVTSEVSNQFIADILVDIHAVRPMPLYSIPGLIDHH